MTNKINMENVQTYKSDLGYDWKTFLNQPKNDDEQESYDYLMSQDNNDTLDIFFMFYPSKPEKGKVEIMIGTEDSNIRCWVDTECYYIAEDKEAYIKNLTSEKINDWLDTLFEFYNSTISF